IETQILETEQVPIQLQPLKQLNWQGTTLEFSEFSKALIESGFIGKIKNEKEVFEKMKLFFNVGDFDKSDKLKQVRQRTKELTPVINVLEVALTNWIKDKD
ncbi:RteC domain-containing protein, partial [Flavobacterium psychrophilum]